MSKEIKNLGQLTRKQIVQDLKTRASEAEGCFFVGFNRVGAFSFNQLRNNLTKAGAKILVTKNSLFKRAFEDLKWQNCDDLLDKETGAVLVYDKDIVKTCKILVEFAKETETLEVKGATIKDKKIDAKEVKAMAKLPAKEVLLAMVVSGLAAPISGFASCLNQVVLKFLWVVSEIQKTKSQSEGK